VRNVSKEILEDAIIRIIKNIGDDSMKRPEGEAAEFVIYRCGDAIAALTSSITLTFFDGDGTDKAPHQFLEEIVIPILKSRMESKHDPI